MPAVRPLMHLARILQSVVFPEPGGPPEDNGSPFTALGQVAQTVFLLQEDAFDPRTRPELSVSFAGLKEQNGESVFDSKD